MPRAGRSSWRFDSEAGGQFPHAVLYVRDALGLRVQLNEAVPPDLISRVPDRYDRLDPADQEAAARDWVRWWTTVIEYESQLRLFRGDDRTPQQFRALVESYHRQAHPETADSLAGSVLRPVAQSLFAEGCNWSSSFPSVHQAPHDPSAPGFDSKLVRDTVKQVAANNHVEASTLDGAATILSVQGLWWCVPAPRFALCSAEAAKDKKIAGEVLCATLESGLAG